MSYTFAIGDIHGCLEELNKMLDAIYAYGKKGKIVFLGDYVDRGPDSKGVIDAIMAGPPDGYTFIALMGNHEDMMRSAIRHEVDMGWWIGNGGAETLASFDGGEIRSYLPWIDSLRQIYSDRHRIFVHAGYDEMLPEGQQSEKDLLWKRFPPHYSGQYGGKHLVHGHTPAERNPTVTGNRTNIDGACVFGGSLVCAVFDDEKSGEAIDYIKIRSTHG